MKKFILILLMIGLCCGCQVKYQVNINEDLTVEERVRATRSAEFFEGYENSSVGRVVGIILRPYLDTLNENEYVVNNYITETNSGVTINKKYSSLDEYAKNTIFISQFGDKINVTKDGSKITISTKGQFSYSEQDQSRIPVNSASISIKIPFKVIENNADSVNGDVYTWNFKSTESKERKIELVFDKDKIASDSNGLGVIIGVVILVIILIVGLIAFKNFKEKKESVNKI